MFEASCNIHDDYYNKGGNEIDRKIADVYLFEYMKQDIKKLPVIKQPYFYMWVLLYYWAVRIYGTKYFYYKKK
jgi:hypothetical protein